MSKRGSVQVATRIVDFWKWLWMLAADLLMTVKDVQVVRLSVRTHLDRERR